MISTPHRQTAVALINEAITAGARRAIACAALEISDRTLRRWTKDGQIHADQCPLVPRPEPANKLSASERAAVLDLCNSTEFASLPPSQIVPKLADHGVCQRSCPPISCSISDFRGADFGFWIEPDGASRLPVAGFASPAFRVL